MTKEELVKEIERLAYLHQEKSDAYDEQDYPAMCQYHDGKADAYNVVLEFLKVLK